MAINTGVNVSKYIAYAVLAPPAGTSVSKYNAYAVLASSNLNPPVWPAFTFAGGVVGVAYSQSWDLMPAASPTTYTLQSGALPTGLSLSNGGGDVGVLAGTPTAIGTFTFTLRATNAFGFADKTFSITIVSVAGGGSFVWMA